MVRKTLGSWARLALAAAGLAAPAAALPDFGVEGSVGSDLISHDHTTPTFSDSIARATGSLPGTAAIEDEAALVGSWGGSATARYFADLARAGIGSYGAFDATHNSSYVGPGDIELWKRDSGQGLASVRAWDTLHVTLPAGDYGDGASADLRGRLIGDLDVVGDFFAQAQSTWQVEVRVNGNPLPLVHGDTGFVHASTDPWPVIGNQSVPVLVPIRFEIPLASGVLVAPKQVDIRVEVFLSNLAAVNSTQGTGSALSDFDGTLYFADFIVPAGATWTSDSGVFLDDPIPEPERWMLLLCGAALLACLRPRPRPPRAAAS